MDTEAKIDYFPGQGYLYADGSPVYQEEFLIPGTALPIGYEGFGKPLGEFGAWQGKKGFWVADVNGSCHRYPFRTAEAADAFVAALKEWVKS